MAYVELDYSQEEMILVEVLKEDYENTDDVKILSAIETIIEYHTTKEEFERWSKARNPDYNLTISI